MFCQLFWMKSMLIGGPSKSRRTDRLGKRRRLVLDLVKILLGAHEPAYGGRVGLNHADVLGRSGRCRVIRSTGSGVIVMLER